MANEMANCLPILEKYFFLLFGDCGIKCMDLAPWVPGTYIYCIYYIKSRLDVALAEFYSPLTTLYITEQIDSSHFFRFSRNAS